MRKHDSEGFRAFACSETISTVFCVYRVGARTLASDCIMLLLKNPRSFNKSIKQMYRYTKACLCIFVYTYTFINTKIIYGEVAQHRAGSIGM